MGGGGGGGGAVGGVVGATVGATVGVAVGVGVGLAVGAGLSLGRTSGAGARVATARMSRAVPTMSSTAVATAALLVLTRTAYEGRSPPL